MQVLIQGIRVRFVHEGHWVKVSHRSTPLGLSVSMHATAVQSFRGRACLAGGDGGGGARVVDIGPKHKSESV